MAKRKWFKDKKQSKFSKFISSIKNIFKTRKKEKPQKVIPATNQNKLLADKLNEALNVASEIQKNFPHGNGEYAKYLEPLMKHLTGYMTDEDNEYYTIYGDVENKNKLYENVRFNELPADDMKVQQYVEKILELDWSSYENYADRYYDIQHNIYTSNITNEKFEDVVDTRYIETLESLMNTSAAWHIATRNAPDSEQAQSNWVDLYNAASIAQRNGNEDVIRQLIRNEVDLDTIERTIYGALKEK